MSEQTYRGSCFCGGVQLTVTGQPEAMGYCHCTSCRTWSGGPVNAFTLWKPRAVKVVAGVELIESFQKTALSARKWCSRCGGHLFVVHEPWQLIDVFAAVIPTFPFDPGLHVNYAEARLPVSDSLPKLHDLPSAMGGSGELVTRAG
ncbi:MAG TPA: GFA family protein [Kofleriaceae bacterium]|jgi:hypothetical protein|nr:GFA family protein [Kofleriaceae bacterium]